ncbi:hypothetical protein IVB54_31865 [Bradyrhizobium sp. CW1]|nr:hypothetical protein IVB54_31865 [Bradyrhizobium sp. CW1]
MIMTTEAEAVPANAMASALGRGPPDDPSSGPHRANITEDGVSQMDSQGACKAGGALTVGFSSFFVVSVALREAD